MKDKVTEHKYLEIIELQEKINLELRDYFKSNMGKGREYLAENLVNKIENVIDDLNADGKNFGRCDYSGDIDYENSEQTYSDGKEMSTGIVLHFCGFSVQATWKGVDKYA